MTKSPNTADDASVDTKLKAMADAHDATTQAPSGNPEQPDNAGADDGAMDTHATIAAQLEADALAAEASAQATADAEAQAKADAIGGDDPATEPNAVLDVARLTELVTMIDQLNVNGFRQQLVDDLTDLNGLQVIKDRDSGAIALSLQGIEVEPAENIDVALTNWTNAARRAIMAGAVE